MDITTVRGVPQLLNSRRGYKSSITAAINKIKNNVSLDLGYFKRNDEMIKKWLDRIDNINNQIITLCNDEGMDIKLDNETIYFLDINNELANIESQIQQQANVSVLSGSGTNDMQVLAGAIASLQNNSLMPRLKCEKFSGKDSNKFEFKNFLSQFDNCTNKMTSGAAKLSYLRSCLSDYALQTISHLTVNDANFAVAVQLLIDEFLDTDYIVDEIFRQLLDTSPKYDPEFQELKSYLTNIKADLFELNTTFQIDLISEGTPGNKFVSHVIYNKLPNVLKRELTHVTKTNYPSTKMIFENYQRIIKTLIKTSNKNFGRQDLNANKKSFSNNSSYANNVSNYSKSNYSSNKSNFSNNKSSYGNYDSNSNYSGRQFKVNKPVKSSNQIKSESFKAPSALESFNTDANKVNFFCKFCSVSGHSMLKCSKFDTVDSRKKRCDELNLCKICTSDKHKSNNCLGVNNKLSYSCKSCNSNSHISALCDNVKTINTNICLNSQIQGNLFLLPIVSLKLFNGNKEIKINCLFDSGSQRSYFSKSILDLLEFKSQINEVQFEVKTFISSAVKKLKEVRLGIQVTNERKLPLQVLIDDSFDIKFDILDLNKALSNFKNLNYKLSADFNNSDIVSVQGLVGVDIIQFMEPISKIKVMNGTAWKLQSGIVPFGNVCSFLYPKQVTPVRLERGFQESFSYNTIIEKFSSNDQDKINFVMKPKSDYEDLLGSCFNESQVERNLEQMFSLEHVGNLEEESDYDKLKIKEFNDSIVYENNTYYVKLPWHEDKINKVPSNFSISLSVLDRVVKKLEEENIYKDYLDVFLQQESEGIIERFEVDPKDYNNYIWIPHRPIIRNEDQVTFKIRPVFNCSLKVRNSLSLNDASYAGINLMGDLLELLLSFRSNEFMMLADIRKAFLMVKLLEDRDKNRFCFFVKLDNKIVAFRYCTLIFGFNASPFILNYVIKYHVSKYPINDCTKMLSNNFMLIT